MSPFAFHSHYLAKNKKAALGQIKTELFEILARFRETLFYIIYIYPLNLYFLLLLSPVWGKFAAAFLHKSIYPALRKAGPASQPERDTLRLDITRLASIVSLRPFPRVMAGVMFPAGFIRIITN